MNNTSQPTEKQKSDQTNDSKAATETPVMTQKQMKEFISTLSNADGIQGDYAFNGFLFFFQTIYEAIRTNPVEAGNLMFELQQHVFNKLMWESYHAYINHMRKAHLIFERAEPFVDLEPVMDLSETELEDLALPLSTLIQNPHLPQSIKDALKNNLNGNHIDFYTPENILGNLKELAEVKDAEEN